jgi:hypothetical protein
VELFREIAAIMLETMPPPLSTIDEALARGDLKRAYEDACSLRGSIATFECPEAVRSLAQWQRHVQASDGASARAALATAQELVHGALAELAGHARA